MAIKSMRMTEILLSEETLECVECGGKIEGNYLLVEIDGTLSDYCDECAEDIRDKLATVLWAAVRRSEQ